MTNFDNITSYEADNLEYQANELTIKARTARKAAYRQDLRENYSYYIDALLTRVTALEKQLSDLAAANG